jgi:hypothetical protein
MKTTLLGVLVLSLHFISFGQFQYSSLPERQILNSSPFIPPAHIRDMTCYSYGNLTFSDYVSDLYVSISNEGYSGIHYKRTQAGNPAAIIYEGIEMLPNSGLVKDAVILKNPNASSPNKYIIAAIYTTGVGGYLTFYEWTLTGLVQTTDYQFTTAPIYYMKMDALDLTYYAVVYENQSDGMLYTFSGATDASFVLVGGISQLLGNASVSTKGTKPDIAMTWLPLDPSTYPGCNIKIYYTYISEDADECIVSYTDFCTTQMFLPIIGLNYEHTINPIIPIGSLCFPPGSLDPFYQYSQQPRIDASDHSEDSWSVIVQQGETYDICPGFS